MTQLCDGICQADPQPLPRISAAEARALGSEALRERKEANDAYIRHIDANGAPPHVIEKHARAEAAASVALELELAHLERKYLTVKTQLEDLERLRVAYVFTHRLQGCVHVYLAAPTTL